MSKLDLDININSPGGKQTLGELRKEIKSLTSEVLQAEEGSKEFLAALNKLAHAKDKLQDLNKAVNALDPGGRAAAFAKLGSTLANGFQAATGAMALFGVQSEDLQKTLLKVQAATAFAQGIQGLKDLGKEIIHVGNIIKIAFAANPVLLIITAIVALGAAIFAIANNVTEYTGEVDKLNDALKTQKINEEEITRVTNNQITALTGIAGKEREILELRKLQIQEQIKTIQASIALNEQKLKETIINDTLLESVTKLFAGETTYRITKAKNIKEQLDLVEKDKKSLDELTAKLTGSITQITNFDKQELDKKTANHKKFLEDKKKAEDDAFALYIEDLKQRGQSERAETESTNKMLADQKALDDAEELRLKKEQEDKLYQISVDATAKSDALDKKKLDDEKKLADAKKTIQQDSFNILASLGTIFINNQKKLEKFNKAAALTQLVLDTAQAISALVKNSEANPLNAPTGGLAGIVQFASGIARILANIAKAKQLLSSVGETPSISLSGGGGGSTAGSITSGNASSGVQFPQNTSTNLQDGKPIKAYVVETEITTSQRKIQNVEERATI